MIEPAIQNIKKEKITDQIYSTLKKLILSEQWPVGYRVPSENDLASQFGVSRMSVRMALQKLQALGLLEVRVGDGSYVKEFSLNAFLSDLGEIILKTDDIRQISEFRKTIELAALKLAIDNLTLQNTEELHSILSQMMAAIQNADDEEFINWDFQFHRKICEISGNELFLTIYDICRSLMHKYYSLNRHISAITKDSIEKEDHVVLFQYMCERNYEKSAELYREMVDFPLAQENESKDQL